MNSRSAIYIYRVGQKVHLGFPVRSYGQTRMNFLVNLIYTHTGASLVAQW